MLFHANKMADVTNMLYYFHDAVGLADEIFLARYYKNVNIRHPPHAGKNYVIKPHTLSQGNTSELYLEAHA